MSLNAVRLIVVSPHPDDETLGAGGLIAAYRRHGRDVSIVAVTDGEAAYPGVDDLGSLRIMEQERALDVLGVDITQITRLHLPDSALYAYENHLTEQLEMLIGPNDLMIAPHIHDYHPDHEICGRAAQKATHNVGARLAHYFFWTWHRGTPEDLQDLALRQFKLEPEVQLLRSRALAEHGSQLHWPNREPILPAAFLAPMNRDFEVFALGKHSVE